MKGLILAAGKGKRFKSLTNKTPKALIPINARPMLGYVIDNFSKTEIREIGIVVSTKHRNKFIPLIKRYDQFKFSLISQEKTLGTAKAVELAKNFIKNDNFILVWCDFLTFYDFNILIDRHKKFHNVATLLLNKGDKPQKTGVVKFVGDSITRIVEKPQIAFSNYGSAGLIVLEPQVIDYIRLIKPAAQNEYHIGDALQLMINEGHKVGYKIINTWRINVNGPEDLKVAEKYISKTRKTSKR